MSLWRPGEEVFTMCSFIVDLDEHPCGCNGSTFNPKDLLSQYTHFVKGFTTIAECPACGATWDDNDGFGE